MITWEVTAQHMISSSRIRKSFRAASYDAVLKLSVNELWQYDFYVIGIKRI